MSDQFNPVAKLLNRDEQKERSLRELGETMMSLEASATAYKEAHKTAISSGWTKRELNGAGFLDPTKLPKVKKITPTPAPSFNHESE